MKNKKAQFLTKAALSGRMPVWAKLVFDISLVISTAITFVVASDISIDPATKVSIGVYTAAAVLVIRGLAKCFGVPLEDEGQE